MAVPSKDLSAIQEDDQQDNQADNQTEEQDNQQESSDKEGEDLDPELETALKALMKYAEEEDEQIRYRLIRQWRRNDLYWNNIQKIYYDDTARDYRTIDSMIAEVAKFGAIDDIKTVNVYRPLVESLVAALSVQPPTTDFPPEDADNPEDVETSEVFTQIAEIISNHNEAPLELIHSLVLLHNSGTIVGVNYYKTDPNYGINRTAKRTEKKDVTYSDIYCPQCGEFIDSVKGNVQPETSKISCQSCSYNGAPNSYQRLDYEEEVVEWEETPKGRSGYKIYSPLDVKLPLYAKRQENCGYAILRVEDNIGVFKETYDRDDITPGSGDVNKYERWARLPVEYLGQLPMDLTTIRYGYFRPWFYHNAGLDHVDILKKEFPNGLMVAFIEDDIMEVMSQDFDKCLTISFDPRSRFIHGEPAGNALIPIQDAKNDLFNLGLQSIEYGIPETFAHPKTLNITKYGQKAAAPGMVTNALPPAPDKSLADGFYTLKTATLSNEYIEFDNKVDGLGQLISGAFPSIYGGGMDDGSKTATEYTESRSRALQRLQLVWQMVSVFWKKMTAKAVFDYVDNLREDENFVQKQNGTYINIWVRKASLSGKVGHVNLDLESELPQSWAQIQGVIFKLMAIPNAPQIGEILLHPNNAGYVKRALGLDKFYVPGANDNNKQWREYYELSVAQPTDDTTPSVDIDLDVDDHQAHMLVLKNILVSPLGVMLYQSNPAGYQNCIAHYRKHEMALQAKTQAPASGSPANTPPPTSVQSKEG